jgi:cytochrome c2
MSAVLIIIVGGVIYFSIKKFPQEPDAVNTSNIIDYDEPTDTLNKVSFNGKALFNGKCASCHMVLKNATGPALIAVRERGPWKDLKNLYQYIRQPETFKKNKYIDSLRKVYGSNHISYPDLTDDEIESILFYIDDYKTRRGY